MTRAQQVLSKAFETHGAAAALSRRTGVSPGVLSRLANGEIAVPSLKISLALQADDELRIDQRWWLEASVEETKPTPGDAA